MMMPCNLIEGYGVGLVSPGFHHLKQDIELRLIISSVTSFANGERGVSAGY